MYYSIGEFSRIVGIPVRRLRDWSKTGRLVPARVAPSGHRYYSEAQVYALRLLTEPCVHEHVEYRSDMVIIRRNI